MFLVVKLLNIRLFELKYSQRNSSSAKKFRKRENLEMFNTAASFFTFQCCFTFNVTTQPFIRHCKIDFSSILSMFTTNISSHHARFIKRHAKTSSLINSRQPLIMMIH